jgi:ADP-heptose:LPS heptosyltransferase
LKSLKVLAIQFKYLGDAVILTPALKALATQIPNIELHVIVASEAAPLLENFPWVAKIWAMPRQRGKAKIWHTLPFIAALRRERFDQSIDFGGNDRGALLSYLSGAKIRIGSIDRGDPKFLQRIGYTQIINRKDPSAPYFDLHFELLNTLKIRRPVQLKLEINSHNIDVDLVSEIIPKNSILCHISTSQPKKDWPLSHWEALYNLANKDGLKLVFSAGPNEREKKLLAELKLLIPDAKILPSVNTLKLFLCILKSSKVFICGDTGPLHFAEGLGVPVIGIFGVGNSLRQVAPIYDQEKLICSEGCKCDLLVNHSDVCISSEPCMGGIQPEIVFLKLKKMLHLRESI